MTAKGIATLVIKRPRQRGASCFCRNTGQWNGLFMDYTMPSAVPDYEHYATTLALIAFVGYMLSSSRGPAETCKARSSR